MHSEERRVETGCELPLRAPKIQVQRRRSAANSFVRGIVLGNNIRLTGSRQRISFHWPMCCHRSCEAFVLVLIIESTTNKTNYRVSFRSRIGARDFRFLLITSIKSDNPIPDTCRFVANDDSSVRLTLSQLQFYPVFLEGHLGHR